jgi:tetratricopeptide (TPR) repeat protein
MPVAEILSTCERAVRRPRRNLFFLTIAAALACTSSRPVLADSGEEARALSQQALSLIAASKFANAMALAQKGLALCDDAGALARYCIGDFNELLGDAATAQSKYQDALPYYEKSLQARLAQLGPDDRLVGITQYRIGRTQAALHNSDAAEGAFRSAAANFEKRTLVERELGATLFELVKIYIASERFDDAVIAARRALDAYIAVQGPDGKTVAVMRRFLGAALIRVGHREANNQNYADAEKPLREGIDLFNPPLPGWEHLFATDLLVLGEIYQSTGRYADAETYELRALDYYEKSADPADPLLLQILAALASHYDQAQNPDASAVYAQRVISVLDKT